MITWVTCPVCVNNLPRKYKNKNERKNLHQPTCNECKNGSIRKNYVIGVKRGVWLKKWQRAIDTFNKAAKGFENISDNENQIIIELMSLICKYQLDKSKTAAKRLFDEIISDRFNILLGKNFKIPEFFDFDPLYYEAKGWTEFLKVPSIENIREKTSQMKAASYEFYDMDYGSLFFSKSFLNETITNINMALNIEAESEEFLGGYYASLGDIDLASIHLSNAASAYMSLEKMEKAKKLKSIRQSLRMETSCWICGSRNKGHGQTFSFKYTGLQESHYNNVINQLKQRQERNPTLFNDTIYTTREPKTTIEENDVKDNNGAKGVYLSTCYTCQGLVNSLSQDIFNNLSQDIVHEALKHIWESVHQLEDEIKTVNIILEALRADLKTLVKK